MLSIWFDTSEWADNKQWNENSYCDLGDTLLLIIKVTESLTPTPARRNWDCDTQSNLEIFSLAPEYLSLKFFKEYDASYNLNDQFWILTFY